MKVTKAAVSRCINIALTVVLIVSAGLLVYITVCAVRGKPVWIGNRCIMQVITGSMEPTLHVGECVIMEKVQPETLGEGDIIAYVSEADDVRGKIVTHRISQILEDGTFEMRGDANPVSDRLHVRKDQVVGRFDRKSGFFTWLMSFAEFRKIGLLVIMLAVSAMAIYEVRTVVLVSKEAKAEKIEDAREQMMREAIDREIERLKAEHAESGKLPEPVPQSDARKTAAKTSPKQPQKTVPQSNIPKKAAKEPANQSQKTVQQKQTPKPQGDRKKKRKKQKSKSVKKHNAHKKQTKHRRR